MSRRPNLPLSFLSRREFLRAGGQLGAAALVASAWPAGAWGQDVVVPGKERMIVRSLRYLDLEMPAHLIESFITPVELFYVRNHLAQPSVNLAEWRLSVTGEVEQPLELTLGDLGKFEQATVTNTLECAGNGRAFQRPRVPGIQWTRGAVGNATFTGACLADVLRRARVKPAGKHVAFNGLDEPPGKVPDFIRSIPMEKAMHPDTLLATQMNGAPLRIEHGYPCRGLVPGWLGAASVKWLIEVRVMENEFDGNFMKPGYRFPKKPVEPGADVSPNDMQVITSLPVKSIIARPGDGAHIMAGPQSIFGVAWAGEADITRVEISLDGGRNWQEAQLGPKRAKYAWRLWQHRWAPTGSGTYTILSRATDSAGRVQPATAAWNPSGYLYNAWDRVQVHVEA